MFEPGPFHVERPLFGWSNGSCCLPNITFFDSQIADKLGRKHNGSDTKIIVVK